MADIIGTAGPDTLSGTSGDDVITGLGGNDTIDDGTPNTDDTDTLNGGDGDDTITLNDTRDIVIGGTGLDTLVLSARPGPGGISINFSALWATGSMVFGQGSISGIERLGTITGSLDDDVIVVGTAYAERVDIAGSSGNDILIGGSGSDLLFGDTGRDYLIGGAGDDILHGGADVANALQGGIGNDIYVVTNAGDSIIEFAGEGRDVVSTFLPVFFMPANVEMLQLNFSNGAAGIGTAAGDEISGSSGADTLIGGGGDDSLYGEYRNSINPIGAADTLIGGLGNDNYFVFHVGDSTIELAGEGADFVFSHVSTHVLQANVESLAYLPLGIVENFLGIGNALDNAITGRTGADTLAGRDGNDLLIGGTGLANTLIGGVGDDTYNSDATGDTIVELLGEGLDSVFASVSSFILPANVENLYFSGQGSFVGIGNALDNRIQGGSGSDTLNGGIGNDILGNLYFGAASVADTLIGGPGDDFYLIGNAGHSVMELAGEGTDTVQVEIETYTLPANVENATSLILGRHTLIGNNLDNRIEGQQAGAFDDILFGGAGNDTLIGNDGNDSLYGGNGSDDLFGGNGLDRFFFQGGETGVDRIINFASGDLVYLSRSGFGASAIIDIIIGQAPLATGTNSALLYDTTLGLISFDADGTGAGVAVPVAQAVGGTTLVASDFIFY